MIPLWLKLAYTIFVAIVVVVYVFKYPLGNFLWFSDIGLLVTVPALWFESALLASMMTVGLLLPEVVWNLSYFARLITGKRVTGMTDYMFDRTKPLYLRVLSLFHVVLPVLLLWMVARLGYVPNAWIAQTALAWVVLPLSYWLTDPEVESVNWAHGPGYRQTRVHPFVYLGGLMLGFAFVLYYPTHLLLHWFFTGAGV